MKVVNPTGPIGSTQSYLLATASGVDANALATTVLSWQPGLSAANTLPLFARITRNTGTITLLVASIRLNATIIQAVSAVQTALLGSGNDALNYSLSSAVSVTVVPLSGNWDIVVGTINGSAATVSISIYGLKVA